MRVVELDKSKSADRVRFARVIGYGAVAFTIILCALIVLNNSMLRESDPMNSPALKRLMAELTQSPRDEELKLQIRELDLLARRAYFRGEQFNQIGIYMLLASLATVVASLKYAHSLTKGVPYPDSSDPKRDLVAEGDFMRRAFAIGGMVLVGFTLALTIPWESPLDAEAVVAGDAPAEAEDSPSTPPTPAPLPALPVPTEAELLANWSTFLGAVPGAARATTAPAEWGEDITFTWKTEVPRSGFSSPIIWGERVFLSGGDDEALEIYSFDIATGSMQWTYTVAGIPGSPSELPSVQDDTGFAAATMATEGNYVFAIFANGDLVAVDFEGNKVWGRNLGLPDNPYGHSSSLVVHAGTLLVQYDHNESGRLLGIDLRDGTTQWETAREYGASWSSPLLIHHNGTPQVVLAAAGSICAYNPDTGELLWHTEALDGAEVACMPVYADGKIFVTADYAAVVAIDVETHEAAWHYDDLLPGVSTPLVVNGLFIAGLSDGGIICLNAETGEEIWFEITDDGFYASPVLASGRIHLMDRAGFMHVFEPAETFTSIAISRLEEEANCTPAFMGGSMLLRGSQHLYRIGS